MKDRHWKVAGQWKLCSCVCLCRSTLHRMFCSVVTLVCGNLLLAGQSQEFWVVSICTSHWRKHRSSEVRRPMSWRQQGEHRTVYRNAMSNSSSWKASFCAWIHCKSCSRFVNAIDRLLHSWLASSCEYIWVWISSLVPNIQMKRSG